MGRPVKRAAVAALVRGGRILLGKRAPDKSVDPLKWALFGGHVKAGESPQAAVLRELKEELGITTAQPRHIGQLPEMDEENRYLTEVYVVDAWEGTPTNLEEHVEIGWFSPDELDDLDRSPGLDAIFEQMPLLEAIEQTRGATASSVFLHEPGT